MISATEFEKVKKTSLSMIEQSGFVINNREAASLVAFDFGLGHIEREGVQIVNYLVTNRLDMKILVFLPTQTSPQHTHPPYKHDVGKEETIRVIWGTLRLYLPGPKSMQEGVIPKGKEQYYTLRHEIIMKTPEQYTIQPGIPHWFQGGNEGAVILGHYSLADDSFNIWSDPQVTGAK